MGTSFIYLEWTTLKPSMIRCLDEGLLEKGG
jgi:hypothetical protein